ncbi:hypothetical protein ACFO5Q_11975 [Kordiimonas lipolytica]|uniref:Uncharacterized protein n=1 Tax=Kordiimonas lipolytica TaxID=1662421 RepID=A0ABV8UBL3_9PROT|nr:hypothetical protein [Kordiimonas lipolytica]
MNDEEFLKAFEDASLDPKLFDHKAHIRMGWIYVMRYPLAEAIEKFGRALRAYTRALEAEAKYHETITWFYMLLIAERQAAHPAATFAAFLGKNRDLVAKPSILTRYYRAETLASDRARYHYVLPDGAMVKDAA